MFHKCHWPFSQSYKPRWATAQAKSETDSYAYEIDDSYLFLCVTEFVDLCFTITFTHCLLCHSEAHSHLN